MDLVTAESIMSQLTAALFSIGYVATGSSTPSGIAFYTARLTNGGFEFRIPVAKDLEALHSMVPVGIPGSITTQAFWEVYHPIHELALQHRVHVTCDLGMVGTVWRNGFVVGHTIRIVIGGDRVHDRHREHTEM